MTLAVTESRLRGLSKAGVSPWSDDLNRKGLIDGSLQRLIVGDGISGVTSNPSIFKNSIAGSTVYDSQISHLKRMQITEASTIADKLMIADVQMAAAFLMPVYEHTNAQDGYVSLEINPNYAYDSKKTIEEGERLYSLVERPNLMLKVPATNEGLVAIEELTAKGIPVNITLIFATERSDQVAEAYIKGLERLAASAGGKEKLSRVASVASFFISRVDAAIDPVIESTHPQFSGQVAIANAKIAYAAFERTFSSPRFEALEKAGAQRQRLLWASTTPKGKRATESPLMYVEGLIGLGTVNTIPPVTMNAFREKGTVPGQTLNVGVDEAHRLITDLRQVIDLPGTLKQLETDGVQLFVQAQSDLLAAVAKK